VVFDSAVDDYLLNHSDFIAKLEDLTSMPAGPTGLPLILAGSLFITAAPALLE
jgi:hypothetical protein